MRIPVAEKAEPRKFGTPAQRLAIASAALRKALARLVTSGGTQQRRTR